MLAEGPAVDAIEIRNYCDGPPRIARLAGWSSPEQVPESTGIEDRDRCLASDGKEVFIPRHEYVSGSCHCLSQNPTIRQITNGNRARCSRLRHCWKGSEHCHPYRWVLGNLGQQQGLPLRVNGVVERQFRSQGMTGTSRWESYDPPVKIVW